MPFYVTFEIKCFYIKLFKGAAVEDGRLKIGDRLLEVNGVEMTGKSQAEAVAVLRNAPAGSKVRIVVSRQEDVPDNGLPRVIVSYRIYLKNSVRNGKTVVVRLVY